MSNRSNENGLNVCMNQDTYNQAFGEALDEYKKEQEVRYGFRCGDNDMGCKINVLVMSIIMIIFYLWALLLALKIKDPEHRTLHVLFALATGPLYVLAHYASMLGSEQGLNLN
jgi:hypothetical protein